jgi:hypothetical protein
MSDELAWFKSSYSDSEGSACVELALDWRKSSYSDSEGSNCVELARDWRKSSYSDGDGSNCVEVAVAPEATVHLRDSKVPDRARLAFPATSFAPFVSKIKTSAM